MQTQHHRETGDQRQEAEKNIIVVGYPKSGNTWITRLIAHAINCPVAGFWALPGYKELAIEGQDRKSPHKVFKSHHSAKTFTNLPDNHHIIYLVRDPRDIATSGAHYFNVKQFHASHPELAAFDKFEAMVHVLIHGGIYSYCEKPWGEHVSEFQSNSFFANKQRSAPLIIRYEDVLTEPNKEITRVLAHLGLHRSKEHIKTAITHQSFSAIKDRETARGKDGRPNFFRKGKAGSFQDELQENLIKQIENAYSKIMAQFKYEPVTNKKNTNSTGHGQKQSVLTKIEILRPKPCPTRLIRIGGNKDGAYLLPDDLEGILACFSPGVSNRKDFEDELHDTYGIACHMCDFSSDIEKFKTPLGLRQTFRKKWLDIDKKENNIALAEWVQELAPDTKGDLILQMDIEGAEYRNLLNTPDPILSRFRIIVLELHGLNACTNPEAFSHEISPLLDLLDKHFICVHAHPNNCCGDFPIPGSNLNLPVVHELTFLRRDRWKNTKEENYFQPMLPHPLDIEPNVPSMPPLPLSPGWLASGERAPESTIKMLSDEILYLKSQLAATKSIINENQDSQHKIITQLHQLAQHAFSQNNSSRPAKLSQPLANLAINKAFTLSSEHAASPKNRQVRQQTPFFFHTEKGQNEFITIDLEKESTLHKLIIKNRTDMCLERASCLFFCLHNSPQAPLKRGLAVTIREAFLSTQGTPSVTNLNGAKARYVTIFSPIETYLHLSSIQVFGETSAARQSQGETKN